MVVAVVLVVVVEVVVVVVVDVVVVVVVAVVVLLFLLLLFSSCWCHLYGRNQIFNAATAKSRIILCESCVIFIHLSLKSVIY